MQIQQAKKLTLPEKQIGFKNVLYMVLTEIIKKNSNTSSQFPEFNLQGKVTLSFMHYLERIILLTGCSKSCFILALILLDKLQQERDKFRLNSENIFKAYTVALLISIKTHDDFHYTNRIYAAIFGMKIEVINYLQNFFMMCINFRCIINIQLFQQYENSINNFAEKNKEYLDFMFQREIQAKTRLEDEKKLLNQKKINQMESQSKKLRKERKQKKNDSLLNKRLRRKDRKANPQ